MSESLQSVQEMMVKEQFCEGWQVQQCTLDEGRRLKRREKNRVAAQRSRKRQMQRADLLHEVCERRACELLEQRNKSLKRERLDQLRGGTAGADQLTEGLSSGPQKLT
ncbi:basic leucine zipper transcriptional factor ATF-like 3 isoform X3 [Oryzias latipes]